MSSISASIVTYKNNQADLGRTIESYLSATSNSKLYVVDNSPTDEARQLCQNPSVEYIFNNGSNMGYGRAHNLALHKSIEHSDYHLVLNPDVYFEAHVIKELLSFMEKNNNVGLVMPKVLFPDGKLQPLCRLLPIPHHLFLKRFFPFVRSIVENIWHEYEMLFTDYETIENVPFLSGCFMLMRTEILRKVGLFDERFFLYFEDTDLSRRIHRQYQTIYYPYVSIYHLHERSSHKELKALLYHIKSANQYFNKWGWFFDPERDFINRKILIKHKVNGYKLQTQ